MLKYTLKFLLIFACFSLNNICFSQITDEKANKFADFVYLIEGRAKTKYPYGVKSIETNGNKEKARRITLNSINNSYKRWEKSGKTNDFVTFFANRWCPPESDKQGNLNWIKNMNYYLKKENVKID